MTTTDTSPTPSSARTRVRRVPERGQYDRETLYDEFACKIRSGGPKDDEADMARPVWAGVLPIGVASGKPVPDGEQTDMPAYVDAWEAGQ